ncbi:MAG: homocysteine biosynthesis protein [Desulfococcaceae bacterium]
MSQPIQKTYRQINERIRAGKAVVLTAEEMIDVVRDNGPEEAARQVDVVTTGTFAPMCSSGAFLNFGQTKPTIKAAKVWFNDVPAYAGLAAVDCYIGATEPAENDPLNRIPPGEFNYGGGHVIEDLVAGKKVQLRATAYGTACYPNHRMEKRITLADLPYAVLCNPRNGYQNYNCAVNRTKKTVYTYMGALKPKMANANYCSAGELSPLFNDPHYRTIGLGARIFLGGGVGYVVWHGTQHNPSAERTPGGVPVAPAGTLAVMGDLREMKAEWLRGVSYQGYGCSLAVGLGIPIPILDADMARYTGVSDDQLFTQVVDYGKEYGQGAGKSYAQVSYAELKSGEITVEGQAIPTVPLSSMVKAREIADILKRWIAAGEFELSRPAFTLPA